MHDASIAAPLKPLRLARDGDFSVTRGGWGWGWCCVLRLFVLFVSSSWLRGVFVWAFAGPLCVPCSCCSFIHGAGCCG